MEKPSRLKRVRVPTVIQMEAVECGAASLTMILGYFGKHVPLEEMRQECGVSRDGSNAKNIMTAARKYGLEVKGYQYTADELSTVELPAIIFWEFNHFVVLEGFGKDRVYLNDPAAGPRFVTYEEFEESYAEIVLVFQKGADFRAEGKPRSLIKLLYDRLKTTPKPLFFLLGIGMCLLIPGFAFPAFLMVFINTFFTTSSLPWKGEFLGGVFLSVFVSGALIWAQLYFLNRLNTKTFHALFERFSMASFEVADEFLCAETRRRNRLPDELKQFGCRNFDRSCDFCDHQSVVDPLFWDGHVFL